MFRRLRSILSAGIAVIIAAEAAAPPVFADGKQAIETVSFSNVSTALTIGVAPDFTAYLEGDALMHAGILNEGWACTADGSIHASKSEGLPVPDEPTGVPYSYVIALTADPGWYFPENITLYYEGTPIDSSEYTAAVRNEGQNLILYCGFIPQVTPQAPNPQALSAAYIFDAVLDYSAGEAPRFTARPADPSLFEIVYERWVDDSNPSCFVTSNEDFNAETGLTAETRLTAFEAGKQYHYDICIAAKYGYVFADDAEVFVNGEACVLYGHPADMIPVNDVYVMTVKAQTAPPVTTTAKPVTTTQNTVTTTKTITTASKPVTTTTVTTKIVTTASKPVTTTAAPVTSTVKATTVPATSADPDPNLLYGDVNQDGHLSIADAALLARYFAKDSTVPVSKDGLRAADMNLDGYLNLADDAILMQRIAELPEDQQTAVPPQPALSDGDPVELPVPDDFTWIWKPEGSSAAFTEKPFDALTVSGEENILSHDGQLKFSPLEMDDIDAAEEMITEDGGLLLDGWHLEAGLGSDGHLPGYYACDYDLSLLEIPEDAYDRIKVLRVDDDGDVSEYPTERDGAVLHWESDQNSVILVVGLVIVSTVFGVKLYQERDKIWGEDETSDKLRWAETPHCYIQYADLFYSDADKQRETRMKLAVKNAEDAVRERAKELTENEWIAWGYDSEGFRLKMNRNIEKLRDEYLKTDTAYQKDLEISKSAQADVLLAGEMFEKAYWYLRENEGCPCLTKKPAIYFGSAVKGDGSAYKPAYGDQYILLHRSGNTSEHVAKDTNLSDIYGKLVETGIADRYLITLTHELYHIYQNTKLSTRSRVNLKFSEMSAGVIEHRAGKYFEKNGDITKYIDQITDKYETYAMSPDETFADYWWWGSDYLIPAGYTLSHFWEYVEKQYKPIKGWDMVLAFEKHGSILETLNQIYNLKNGKDTVSDAKLGTYWKAFHLDKEQAKKELSRAGTVEQQTRAKQYADDTELLYFPSLMHITNLNKDTPKVYIPVKLRNFSCTQVMLCSKTEGWTAILVRDKDFFEKQPGHTFLIPEGADGKPIGAETKNGVALNSASKDLQYRELQWSGNLKKTGYTAHFIPAPETPEVTYDYDTEEFTVKLKSAQSDAGAAGLTDKLMLICCVNGKEACTKLIEPADWAEPITITAASLKLLGTDKNTLTFTACEYIEEGSNQKAWRTAASKPYVKEFSGVDFPVISSEFVASGSYGDIIVGSDSKSYFTLDREGCFTFRMDEGGHEDSPLNFDYAVTNPFAPLQESSKLHYSGFTISGQAKDAESADSWSGKITACNPPSFSAQYSLDYFDAKIIPKSASSVQDLRDEYDVIHVESSFSATVPKYMDGTLTFNRDPETGVIRVSFTLDVRTKNPNGILGTDTVKAHGTFTVPVT